MKKIKKYGIIGVIIIGVVIGGILITVFVRDHKEVEKYQELFQDKDVVPALADILSDQEKSVEKINNILRDSSCTFDNPCVVRDPFEIAPLTALVIFQTKDEEEVIVSINDVEVTKMEKSKLHSIPIYGLQAGIENHITLNKNGDLKEITVDCQDVYPNNLDVSVENPTVDISKDVYFMSSNGNLGTFSYDGKGNLVWLLAKKYALDIEWANNGHMYLGNDISSGLLECYDGFYEIDYFGKIHKKYSLKNGYHHELIALSDGSIIVAGGNASENRSLAASYVYQINSQTGDIINQFDVYDILAGIDEEFANGLKGTDIMLNSIYYDEDSKEMILSLRGINSILSLNFETKKINWILGDSNYYSSAFAPYLLQMSDGSRLPKGSHTAFLTKEGYLGLYNNDYDALNIKSEYLQDYQDNYSSVVLYEIDGKNIKTHWEYDAGKQYFGYALGSFQYNEKDKSKLIDFGWIFNEKAYLNNISIHDNYGYTSSRIIELDQDDQVIFNATIPLGIYRVFKHSFYDEVTKNYLDYDFTAIDNSVGEVLEKKPSKDFYETFLQAEPSNFEFDVNRNTIQFNVIFDRSEVVDLFFVSENKDTYVLHYKKKDQSVPMNINLKLQGNYAVYVKINDHIYDTGKVFSF